MKSTTYCNDHRQPLFFVGHLAEPHSDAEPGSDDASSNASNDTAGASTPQEKSPNESDHELDHFVGDPVVPPIDDAPPVVVPVLPDPIHLAKPDWGVGIELAELAPTAKSLCVLCKAAIAKDSVRMKYWQNPSTFRFVHPQCVADLPAAHKPHSVAMLSWQRHFGVAAHHASPMVLEKVVESLALLT